MGLGFVEDSTVEVIFTWQPWVEGEGDDETDDGLSDNGLDCYTDCSETLAKAILTVEKAEIKLNLPKSDKTIILTASKEKLQELINLRARDSENNEKAIIRALKIQEHLIKLARKESLIIIDRSNLDFTKEEDLKKILKKIKSLN